MTTALQKIALVDDHNLLRSGLANLINSFDGFSVIFEANNGKDLIRQLSIYPSPDILLLDINMPVMNGYETAEWMKKNQPQTKVLVLTMLDSDLAIIKMLNLGAKGFLFKDSHPDQFLKALIQVRDLGFCLNEFFAVRSNQPNQDSKQPVPFPVLQLSEKELELLRLVCTEATYREIADLMSVSPRTVDSYRDALFRKLHVSTRVGLVLFSIRNGIVMV